MRALVWDGERLLVQDRADPEPGPGMAVVRVHVAGVCRTDVEIVRGYMGFRGVLGHEFVGTVVQGSAVWKGARVVGEINFGCTRCDTCRKSLERHCPSRRVMGISGADGAFADLVTVPERNLHRIPEGVPDEVAVFTEPVAAAFEVFEQLDVVDGRSALVLGDGKLGLLVAQVLRLVGADVRLAGKHPEKLAIARSLGIETMIAGDEPPEPAALVVEATGSVEGLRAALHVIEPRGTLVLKSTYAGAPAIDLSPLVINEVTLVGSRCGPFPPALSLLANEEVHVKPLVSDRFPLTDAGRALERAAEPGVLKVLIEAF